ncbi:MAG: excinuclease ABC subunit A [Pedobacter sp.]|nr:MAG: excinuclease ABC subunit A [Pedobacter sp.]
MSKKEAEKDPHRNIIIKGARVHNLKNIDVAIPKNKLVVVTGMSGSGKSSLAFDTLYAEGQRRYVESLSSYARQFMGRMNKPDVDYIKGIAPAIAIEQKVITSNPRSTVGTSTEIYDYLKLLFSRIGKTISPVSGKEVKKDSVSTVVDYVSSMPEDTTVTIFCPLYPHNNRTIKEELAILLQKGFLRVLIENKILKIESVLDDADFKDAELIDDKTVQILIDRIVTNQEEETLSRLADSVQTAFFEGKGDCYVEAEGNTKHFSDRFELDGIKFEEPTPNFFSFNNPYGACKRCEGYGNVIGIDEDLVIPDKSKSVFDNAIAPWRGEKMSVWLQNFIKASSKFDFPIHRPFSQLTEKEQKLLWTGNKYFAGLDAFFKELEEQTYKIQYRVMLSRYRGKTTCPECKGSRLRKDASYVKIAEKSIIDVVLMPLAKALVFFNELKLNPTDTKVAKRLLAEIDNRFLYLNNVGLGYLTLNRLSNTLSGGESQRINLATSLGSSLVGSIYVLDEPSIGLHPRDTNKLIEVLISLRNVGNTVLVVEHEEEMMRAADYIIDIGPEAGTHGGNLVFSGNYEEILKDKNSLTGRYLSGVEKIAIPEKRRKWKDHILIKGARENNLKNIDVKFPLGVFTAVSGVSGSGKTSLVKKILYPALQKAIGNYAGEQTGAYDGIFGNYDLISAVEMVDQNPIGRSSRSNPVTYVKAWDDIRALFSGLAAAKAAGLKNVSEILDMTIDEAVDFFKDEPKILNKLNPLVDVGLGYVHLGQSSNTLSGGEAQRIKLASFLIKGNNASKTLFIFDEPTTGLHFHDIKKLLKALNTLIEQGNTILVIEHNMDMIKCADWVIDIGPEGGDGGGQLVFEGVPEDLIKEKSSYTGKYLASHLNLNP